MNGGLEDDLREALEALLRPGGIARGPSCELAGHPATQPPPPPDRALDRMDLLGLAASALRRLLVRRACETLESQTRDPEPHWAPARLLLALECALERLAALAPEQARIAELRYFGGLNASEVARLLHLPEETVEEDWSMGRAWLLNEIRRAGPSGIAPDPPRGAESPAAGPCASG